MDSISEITDLKRLYQLYIMTDKILNNQLNSKPGINYETLKRFKIISLRINYLHMQEFSSKAVDLKHDTKDIYEEQKKLTLLVKLMKDANEAHNMLISKYRKYSSLPLIFDDSIDISDLDYYSDKLENINEYIKNESYISRINDSMNELGIELGNKTKELDDILSLIPLYEKKLRNYVIEDSDVISHLNDRGFNVMELLDDVGAIEDKYDMVMAIYNESLEKYDAIKYVDSYDYADVVREINNEYQSAKTNKSIIEILKSISKEENEYEDFYRKRVNIKTNLIELDDNIFGRKFNIILKEQMDICNNVNDINEALSDVKDKIHKNNLLLSNLKRNQTKLKKLISRKKEVLTEDEINRQVVSVDNSHVNYSKERVNNVLKFVFDKISESENESDDESGEKQEKNDLELEPIISDNDESDIYEEVSDSSELFSQDTSVETGNNSDEDNIFENVADSNQVFDNEINIFEDDIKNSSELFEKIDDSSELFTDDSKELKLYDLGNNIFNDRIDSEIYSPNVQFMNSDGSFWPNIG